MTRKDAALMMNVAPATLAQWQTKGEFMGFDMGGKAVYRIEDIEAYQAGKKPSNPLRG